MTGANEQNASRRAVASPQGPPCPVCGSLGVRIAYGMPGPDLVDAGEEGRLVLGGCVVTGFDPEWACTGPEQHVWRAGEEDRAVRAGDWGAG